MFPGMHSKGGVYNKLKYRLVTDILSPVILYLCKKSSMHLRKQNGVWPFNLTEVGNFSVQKEHMANNDVGISLPYVAHACRGVSIKAPSAKLRESQLQNT